MVLATPVSYFFMTDGAIVIRSARPFPAGGARPKVAVVTVAPPVGTDTTWLTGPVFFNHHRYTLLVLPIINPVSLTPSTSTEYHFQPPLVYHKPLPLKKHSMFTTILTNKKNKHIKKEKYTKHRRGGGFVVGQPETANGDRTRTSRRRRSWLIENANR